jgi:hypothetical protein
MFLGLRLREEARLKGYTSLDETMMMVRVLHAYTALPPPDLNQDIPWWSGYMLP